LHFGVTLGASRPARLRTRLPFSESKHDSGRQADVVLPQVQERRSHIFGLDDADGHVLAHFDIEASAKRRRKFDGGL
jgi:hypothetical protein